MDEYVKKFERVRGFVTANSFRLRLFHFVYRVFPLINIAAYPMLIIYLLYLHDVRVVKCLAVPAFMVVSLSAARHIMNFPRPYEKYDITPIISKNKKGRSFPSRHTASAAVIGVTFLYINPTIGIIFLVIALFVGISRAVCGVHFPRDVIAGYVYALLCGALYLIKINGIP